VILDMLEGQYSNPIGVFGFNPFEGWSQDVSADVAQDIAPALRSAATGRTRRDVDFVELHEGKGDRQLSLRLAK
jgi:hypothetical protein